MAGHGRHDDPSPMKPVASRPVAALRWLGGRRALLPTTARYLCSRTVIEWPSFFVRETLRRRSTRSYRVRESGLRVAIRHRSTDVPTLSEVFYHRYYAPPERISEVIGRPTTILDLGANVGLFGTFAAASWPTARITGYEPDEQNARVHEQTISANGLQSRWTLIRAAVGAHNGEVAFASGLGAPSHVIVDPGSRDPQVLVPLLDVLRKISTSNLVKMDIEGAEWDIVTDPRFTADPPRVIVIEYHPYLCPGPDPHAAAELALRRAGLQTSTIWQGDEGVGMLWGWRA